MAQDRTNVAPFANSGPYSGDVLSNTESISNNTAAGHWRGNVVTNAGAITNNAEATWQGGVIDNTGNIENHGIWLDGEITENRHKILNRDGATWRGDTLAIGASGSQLNWGNWVGNVGVNKGVVYNDGVWTGDVLDNRKDIANGLDSNHTGLWIGDVLGNSSFIANYSHGRWQGDVVDNAGDIANYADWTGDLTNRGRIINYGTWTGNVVHTSTFFWAQNQIVGNFDNRGQLQLLNNLDVSGLLTNSGRLQLTLNAGLQTLSVGSALFAPTSLYEIDVTAMGGSDRIVVAGAANLGGTVLVKATTAGGGTFDEQKSYTILSAGKLSGTFDSVSTDLTFLSPHLSYDAGHVYLGLRRNDVGFDATGATGNQVGVGAAVEALGPTSAIYDAVLWLTPEQAQAAFDQLSGEVYDSADVTAVQNAGMINGMIQSRINQAFDALGDTSYAVSSYAGDIFSLEESQQEIGLWARFYGAGASSSEGAAPLHAVAGGMVMGADSMLGDWRLGAMLQFGATGSAVPLLNSTVSSADYGVGVYAGRRWGATQLSLGGVVTLHDTKSARDVTFLGFSNSVTAAYLAGTGQAFAELSHKFDLGIVSVMPYAGLAQVRYATAGIVETGGPAAVTRAGQVVDATFATLGLGAQRSFVVGEDMLLTARASLGWRHGFISDPGSVNALAGAPSFGVTGTQIASDLAVFNAGLTLDVTASTNLDLAYDAQIGRHTQSHALKATWATQF